MIHILIPLAGKTTFFDTEEYPFPKPVIEITGKPMIELVLANFLKMKRSKKFIFIVKEQDCSKFHLDSTLKLLTDGNCEIVKLSGETKGAACSALMAVKHINNDEPLIISNGDQIIDGDFESFIQQFEKRKVDGGVVCFDSVHPKWSYVKLDENNKIIQATEKNPISKNAIAGFYYFSHGNLFVRAAMSSIEKDASVGGLYYIAPVYNELVLENKNLEVIKIKPEQYHSFYSPQKIKEYEEYLKK